MDPRISDSQPPGTGVDKLELVLATGFVAIVLEAKKLPKSSTVDLSSVSNAQDLKHEGRIVAKGTDNKADQDLRGEDGQAIQDVLWWQSCAKKIVSLARR